MISSNFWPFILKYGLIKPRCSLLPTRDERMVVMFPAVSRNDGMNMSTTGMAIMVCTYASNTTQEAALSNPDNASTGIDSIIMRLKLTEFGTAPEEMRTWNMLRRDKTTDA